MAFRSTSFRPDGCQEPARARSAACARCSPVGVRREGSTRTSPDAVIGFGGYPAVPGSARRERHGHPDCPSRAECGARTRQPFPCRRGCGHRDGLYGGRPDEAARYDEKTVLVGNPVRDAIAKLGETPFPPFDEYAPFKILVTGGSQGATVLSKVVPEGLGLLSPSLAPAPAGDAAVPARRHRRGPYELCPARHSRRADDLYRGHAGQAGRGASGHRALRRFDCRGADRRRPTRDPHSLSGRYRRPSDCERHATSPKRVARA